jgi:uncharacterized protein DUF6348
MESVRRTYKFGIETALLLAVILSACSRSKPTANSNDLFVTWLQNHGESNVVVDARGVGLVGKATRLRSSLYGSRQFTNSFTAELEFRVRIPDGREIVEFVAGSGDSLQKAQDDARLNFVVSTFHVVYRSFMNSNDTHQAEEKITIDGRPRRLILGDTMTRAGSTNSSPDMFPLRDGFRKILSSAALSEQTHWIKIVYANHHSKTMMCAVTLDNQDSPALTEAVKALPWPKQEDFYLAKQFIVVK